MSVRGIVLDETSEAQIRACGFTNFKWDTEYDEMNDNDQDGFFDWLNDQQDKIEELTKMYMMGMEDAKVFYFSDMPNVVNHIAKTFPGCEVITVSDQDLADIYSLDYDYRRDNNAVD